jgi:hypothetical protein
MKQMKTTVPAHCFEFCFPRLDTLVQVEETDGEVVIRATRDTFSEERKLSFIHELAEEGFIPDRYRWFALASYRGASGVCWLVDYSWLKLDEAMLARTRRFMVRILSSAALLWLVMMASLLLRSGR